MYNLFISTMTEDKLITLLKQTKSESFAIQKFGAKESGPRFIVLVKTNNVDKLVSTFSGTEFKIETSEQLAVFDKNPIIEHFSSDFKQSFVEFKASKKADVLPQKNKHNNFKKTSFRQQNYKKKNNYIATKSMRI